MDQNFGSSYVHLKANQLCLDQELCWVDIDEFLSLIRDARERNRKGQENVKEALSSYKQALELYGGDFLAEEPYVPWAEMKREELRRNISTVYLVWRLSMKSKGPLWRPSMVIKGSFTLILLWSRPISG